MIADVQTLTWGGWTIMILSVGSVVTLLSFCLYRVLTLPPVEVEEEQLKGPPDIETGDRDDAD